MVSIFLCSGNYTIIEFYCKFCIHCIKFVRTKIYLIRTIQVRMPISLQLTARRYNLVGVTRRKHRVESRYPAPAGPQNCHGARRVRRSFCHPGTSFVAFWCDRGTIMIGAVNLSPVTNLVRCTCAVSRYKLSRNQKTVKIHWN